MVGDEAGEVAAEHLRQTRREGPYADPELLRLEAERLMHGDYFDLLMIRLYKAHSAYKGLAEEAIANGLEALVRQRERVNDIEPWLWRVSLYQLDRLVRRAQRTSFYEVDLDEAEESDDVADDILARETFRIVMEAVSRWDNARIRVVTLLFLEAAVEMEPLTDAQAADLAGQILGEEINVRSVSQWKARGLRKLRDLLGRSTSSQTNLLEADE